MFLKGSHTVRAPREKVWEALNRPEILREVTPGCKRLVVNDAGGYDAELEVGVGAIKGRFTGTIEIKDRVPGSQYQLAISASGNAGFLNAEGLVVLKEENGGTLIEYAGQAQVGGPIASVGQRMVEGVAKRLVGQFFRSFEEAMINEQ
jgi:carbon monoxide dehydrogenase subunit G